MCEDCFVNYPGLIFLSPDQSSKIALPHYEYSTRATKSVEKCEFGRTTVEMNFLLKTQGGVGRSFSRKQEEWKKERNSGLAPNSLNWSNC